MKKVCVVSTSRADYGLLYWLLRAIEDDKTMELQLVVSGMHLSPKYGSTYKAIEKDGFRIARKVPILRYADDENGITKTVGLACQKFADVFRDLKPDWVVLLGDRYEMMAPALAAYFDRIPIAHIHGGELTEGALDEGIRHSLTKLSSLHFASTEVYRRRIIQMGEQPDRVFHVGAPALDHMYKTPFLEKDALSRELRFTLDGPIAVATIHPETLNPDITGPMVEQTLKAIRQSGLRAIFTKANADPHGQAVNARLERFCAEHPDRFRLFDNLGQRKYYSLLKYVDVMVGNSSSGLLEAASFGLPVVNIGDRQKSRVRSANVIDAPVSGKAIQDALRKALSPAFKKQAKSVKSPYDYDGKGMAGQRIKDVIKRTRVSAGFLQKRFNDLQAA